MPSASRPRANVERLAVIIAVLGPAIDAASSQEGSDLFQSTVLCAFDERLAQYAALHRELEAPLPLKPSVSAYWCYGIYTLT